MFRVIKSKLERLSNWKWAMLISVGIFIYGFLQKGCDNNFINADGKGYYAYLPAVFIYHDLSFGFIPQYEKKHYQPGQYSDIRNKVPGGIVNRYYVGTALMELPFFLIAHFLTWLTQGETDGYSMIYQYSILSAACFYLFWGLLFLFKTLNYYFDRIVIFWTGILITLATPLLFFSTFNPDYSHIYSFSLICILYYLFHKNLITFSYTTLASCSALLGLLIITRPSNGIFILSLPFIAGEWTCFKQFLINIFRKKILLVGCLTLFTSILFIQLVIYYIQTGHFLVYSYEGANFNFADPHFIDVLFSYNCGLFVYTPILFISLGGFIFFAKRSIFAATGLFLFLGIVIYVVSSWECWWYGATIWMRPIVDFMAFFAFLLAGTISLVKSRFRNILFAGLSIFIIHNFIQIYQFKKYIYCWGCMNKENYWKVFLKTDPIYRGYLWGGPTAVNDQVLADSSVTLSAINPEEVPWKQFVTENSLRNAPNCLELKSKNQLPIIKVKPYYSECSDSVSLVIMFKIFPNSDILKSNILHFDVQRIINPELSGFSMEISLRNLEPFKWNMVQKVIKLPKIDIAEEFNVTLLNKGKYSFYIDDIKIEQLIFNYN